MIVYQPLVLVGIGAVVLLILVIGVALPAVWSRKPDRRKAAAAVLRLLVAGRATANDRVSRRSDKAKSAAEPYGNHGQQQG